MSLTKKDSGRKLLVSALTENPTVAGTCDQRSWMSRRHCCLRNRLQQIHGLVWQAFVVLVGISRTTRGLHKPAMVLPIVTLLSPLAFSSYPEVLLTYPDNILLELSKLVWT